MFSSFELPVAPWHAAHGSAFALPAAASPALAAPARRSAAASVAPARWIVRFFIAKEREPAGGRLPSASLLVGDAVDRAVPVVGDEERPVLHLLHVDRAAPELVGLEEPFGERL